MEIIKAIGIAASITGWMTFIMYKHESDEHDRAFLRKTGLIFYATAATVAIIVTICG